ncbi:TatD family hydrolase [Paenibacillus beijingensis]|uniref:DNAase n=1 Tax=Paenibacillus beijingensis TaxID=1126833 RepID=A0A0D5NME3_9BACL|nr:TatD family hydrolase [Paenibacillus beijingensis]AJY76499.1 DNAase [Paenibacillus beijingensis]
MAANSASATNAVRQPAVIDAHVHLDQYPEPERSALLAEAFASGVEAVVAVSMHEASCREVRRITQHYPGRIIPAYGYHPEQPLPAPEAEERLLAWIAARHEAGERFAIGEVGLPYYSRTAALEEGRDFNEAPFAQLLERFAALAVRLGQRPLVLHAVYEDAHKACDILERTGVERAHFHWFKGDEAAVNRMAGKGYMISVTPDVLYEEEIRELVRRYPLALMMTETDGPWPFEGPFAGVRTNPLMMRESVRAISELKGISPEETAHVLLGNARRFYNLDNRS